MNIYMEDHDTSLSGFADSVNFRLERIEQALLIFSGEVGSNPHHAADELRRVLRLTKAEFTDAALQPRP